jgi:hypothetical protein
MPIEAIKQSTRRTRRGSLGLEVVLIIPFAVMFILLGRFVLEAVLTRHEVAVFTRGSAVRAAQAAEETLLWLACTHDREPFTSRAGISQSVKVDCRLRDGERGLQRERPFFRTMRNAAGAWPDILRDVDPGGPIRDVLSEGTGSMQFDRPPFLATRGSQDTEQRFMLPQDDVWDHGESPWSAGYDPVIWDELSRHGTYRLFPNLFPARDK